MKMRLTRIMFILAACFWWGVNEGKAVEVTLTIGQTKNLWMIFFQGMVFKQGMTFLSQEEMIVANISLHLAI